jgi:RimJ/RimL family protein N-acetyltransferase
VIELWPVNVANPFHLQFLYDLLAERTPEQSISHKTMPTWDEHVRFVGSRPYLGWHLIAESGYLRGAIYLTKQREIGVGILRSQQRKGYARAAVLELMDRYTGPFLANVNPKNEASIKLWESLGFNLLQVTYQL